MTEEPDEAAAGAQPAKKPRPTKAERLEAKAARLRDAEARRASATQTGSGEGSGRAVWTRVGPALAAATAVFLALAIVFFIAWLNSRDSVSDRAARVRKEAGQVEKLQREIHATEDARQSVLRTAQQYAIDFGSYDYRHLDADFAKVASHLTPAFKKSYVESSSKLEPTIVQYKGASTATVQGIGLTNLTESRALVVILLDQRISTSQSATPRIDRNRLEMTLVKSDGKWLINKLELV
jgi:Mce-associated membrane protein